MATEQQRAAIFAELLAKAKASARSELETLAAASDKTDWSTLCPAADPVTQGYVQATPSLSPLVCARALSQCSDEALQRGGLYPFVIGQRKSNGLLNAVLWLCDKYSAHAYVSGLCSANDAAQFVLEGSSAWHLLCLVTVLGTCTVTTKQKSFTLASAHAAACGSDSLESDVNALSRVAFIQNSHSLPTPPSITMTTAMWATVPGSSVSSGLDLAEIDDLLLRVLETDKTKASKHLPQLSLTNDVWLKFNGLCALHRVPDGLSFDV